MGSASMRKILIAVLAACIRLAGSATLAGAGLFSATGMVIAILAGDLFVGEAEGHLSGTKVQLIAFNVGGNSMQKIVLKSALMLISALAATSNAATLASSHIPSAGGGVRDAPFNPRNPNSTPVPAPAATNHYAGLVENPSRPVFRPKTGHESIPATKGLDRRISLIEGKSTPPLR